MQVAEDAITLHVVFQIMRPAGSHTDFAAVAQVHTYGLVFKDMWPAWEKTGDPKAVAPFTLAALEFER